MSDSQKKLKKGGAVWKKVFGRKSPKRKSRKRKSPKRKSRKRKSPKRKSRKRKSPKRKSSTRKLSRRKSRQRQGRHCKSGQVINPETGRCIKKGGAVWKRVFGKKIFKFPQTKRSPFHRELEEKLIVKAVCDDLKVTNHVKSYMARTYMLTSCINNDIPLRASVSIWDRWIREIKKKWVQEVPKIVLSNWGKIRPKTPQGFRYKMEGNQI